jgi:hypothetical protein
MVLGQSQIAKYPFRTLNLQIIYLNYTYIYIWILHGLISIKNVIVVFTIPNQISFKVHNIGSNNIIHIQCSVHVYEIKCSCIWTIKFIYFKEN